MTHQSLIRILSHQLDAKQKDKILLEAQVLQLQEAITRIENDIAQEERYMAENQMSHSDFSAYFKRSRQRIEELKENKLATEKHLEAIEIEMVGYFGEIKKYEMLQQKKQQHETEQANALEQAFLDENTLAHYASNHD